MNFNQFLSAEREGFEPPEPLSSTVFKTAAIDHSAISPSVYAIDHSAISPSVYATHFRFESGAKLRMFFDSANLFACFLKKRVYPMIIGF